MFEVVKRAQYLGDEVPGFNYVMVSDLKTRSDALVLAEVAALEHAERLGVEYKTDWPVGFELMTNNGTIVWYSVKEIA